MSSPQPLLFSDLELATDAPIARSADPITSHDAAAAITSSGVRLSQLKAVLDLVQKFPGSTAAELAKKGKLDRHTPSRRLPELEKALKVRRGEIRVCRVKKTKSLTWFEVPQIDGVNHEANK